jgi:serine/threonine protein kinase
MEYMDCG